MQSSFSYDHAFLAYQISKKPSDIFTGHVTLENGLVVNHTANTTVMTAVHGSRQIAIIGICVDSHGELARDEIPAFILQHEATDIDSIYHLCNRFAGRYVMLYGIGADWFAFGDAVCSVQINYAFDGDDLCIGVADKLAADYFGFQPSPYSLKIRNGSNYSQGLPNDITMYDQVKALLPNHYLDLTKRQAVRMKLNINSISSEAQAAKVALSTAPLIQNITRELSKHCNILCPLTSGYDSRVVYMFTRALDTPPECYTVRGRRADDVSSDICVSERICRELNTKYTTIDRIQAPKEYVDALFQIVGPYHASNTVDFAYSIRAAYEQRAVAEGSIIDQIGKSLLGNALPNALASPSFFQCKIHNQEPLAKKELKKYVQAVKAAGQQQYIFDLFAMENRCGRWMSQSYMLYDACSVLHVNLFNCGEVIERWISIPRKYRAKMLVHKTFFSNYNPKLLEYPFNPGAKYGFVKKNAFFFYIATYAKWLLAKLGLKT